MLWNEIMMIRKLLYLPCLLLCSFAISFSTSATETVAPTLQQPVEEEQKPEPPLLPAGCKLQSFITNGSGFSYQCDDNIIMQNVFFPSNKDDGTKLTDLDIIDTLQQNLDCQSQAPNATLGQVLYCEPGIQKTKNSYIYVKSVKSSLIVMTVTTSAYNETAKLEILQNFAVKGYFFFRQVVKSYEEADALINIFEHAQAYVVQDEKKENKETTGKTPTDKPATSTEITPPTK